MDAIEALRSRRAYGRLVDPPPTDEQLLLPRGDISIRAGICGWPSGVVDDKSCPQGLAICQGETNIEQFSTVDRVEEHLAGLDVWGREVEVG
jgi:hypothetical protein